MRTTPKELGEIAVIIAIAAAGMATIPAIAGSRIGFAKLFIWGLIALTTILISVLGTFAVITRFRKASRSAPDGDGWVIGGYLLAAFVIAQLLLTLVFWALGSIL